jgi:hypothetical protein
VRTLEEKEFRLEDLQELIRKFLLEEFFPHLRYLGYIDEELESEVMSKRLARIILESKGTK